MVTYIRSDLDFILDQIKIAEAHAAGQPLYGPGGLVPSYTLSLGLRTVDGTFNNLLPGQETWGAAGFAFPEPLPLEFRPADGTLFDPDGPGPAPAIPTALDYTPSNNPGSLVFDSSLRTISNLIVDQSLGNPSAVLKALASGGVVAADLANLTLVQAIQNVFQPFADAFYQAGVASANAHKAYLAAQAAYVLDPTPANEAIRDAALILDNTNAGLLATATTNVNDARVIRDAALPAFGITMDGDNVSIPNVATDGGLSASFNSWFTLFGQFFDHGLDLINKGGSGTVFIPLQPDDPLYVVGSHTNFMVLTRATVSAGLDGLMGTEDDVRPVNTTTSFVDQNQTYTSHSSHQVFLRQYEMVGGRPVSTGNLIEGGGAAAGGMATWGEVKAQALLLGIELTDFDVGNVPLLRTDAYGNFIPNAAGFAQIITGIGLDGIPNTADDTVVSGTNLAPVNPTTVFALRTGNAFLADIAHNAVPVGKIADGDIEIGLANPNNGSTEYDNELLDAHFIAGDGRVNENIGLTAVHSIFHSEHNRLADQTKSVVLADAATMLANGSTQAEAVAFLNEWLATDVVAVPVGAAAIDALVWDGNRLFQAAKFGTEMQYQHLVFEDFARKIQPNIDFFVVPDGYHADINPSIVSEFANVVYRFGHSMLTETVDRVDAQFNPDNIGLIEAFLNPVEFDSGHTIADSIAAGDIIRGMTRQVGNEIDEFVTGALRNNLLGLPLDLATINLARGRDTGVPSLNAARREFYEVSNQAPELKPYTSWIDFAGNLKNEASVINFVAAYGTHISITSETTIDGKRDAAMALVFNQTFGTHTVPLDRDDFLNSTGAYANNVDGSTVTGVDVIDLWIGGLAEKTMIGGGMLGATFNFVFEVQMEKLQDGDRFYYLQRLDGLHLLAEMENNTFAKLILKNADAGHLPSDVFSTPGLILEIDRTKQYNVGLGEEAGADGFVEDQVGTALDETLDNLGIDPTGGSILTPLVIRNNPATPGLDTNYLRYTGDAHVLLGGTDGNDHIISSEGDDTLYGDGGNDRLEGGQGNDSYIGGDGDDIITDLFGDDIIRSGAGNDAVNAGVGTDLVIADEGNDFIVLGADLLDETFLGLGNDYVLGSKTTEQSMGGEGDDWIEIGAWTGAIGDNFDDQFAADSVKGHDVFRGDGGFDEFIGEGGDDIWIGTLGRGKFDGMSGFDWATYKDYQFGANADLTRQHFDALPLPPPNSALDEYSFVEGVSGSAFNDQIFGDDGTAADVALRGFRGSVLTAEGIALIAGLQDVVGAGVTSFDAGNILLGGAGSDEITGRGGNDIIDGDKWLNVRVGVFQNVGVDGGTGAEIDSANSLKELVTEIFNGTYNPGQLRIVREIITETANSDIDVAVFSDLRANYDITYNADGTVTVNHARGTAIEGVDTLRNMEQMRFSDVTIAVNAPATGAPVINDLTPTEGFILSVDTSSIEDSNGLGVFTHQWQSSTNGVTWTNIAGAIGTTFTPQDLAGILPGAQAGLQLRVQVTYTDGGGTLETLFSAPTSPVGLNWANTANTNNITFTGNAGDDIANGGTQVDNLNGNAGNDNLDGNGGNDVITGGAGDDTIDGGVGTGDVAVYAGAATNFGFSTGATVGTIAVTDGTGAEGVDTVIGVETLRFNGQNYTVTNGSNGVNIIVPVLGNLFGAGQQAIFGYDNNDTLNGGIGNDIIDGGLGTDSIIQTGATGGHDIVNGGAGNDTYTLNGAAGAELFNIYTRAAYNALPAADILNTNTEIVITRNGTIIAELDNIEEIVVNALNVSANDGNGVPNGGVTGGDTVSIFGDFNAPFTSLNFNTITVNGGEGDDTVDISALESEHRIVFNTGAGDDEVIGDLRTQDVVNYGVTADLDEDDDDDDHNDNDDDDDNATPPTVVVTGLNLIGDANSNLLAGAAGDDVAMGNGGDDMLTTASGSDMLFGGAGNDTLIAGDGNDMTYGEAGNDRIFAGNGNDMVDAGTGNDTAIGGSGDDMFIAATNDGNDTYYGDAGIDTLDMSSIIDGILANLGTGLNHNGSVQTGGDSDVLWSVENIVTGSGNDTITASSAHNVIDTGSGTDTVIFRSASDADGDTILNFRAGDKIDVSGFMGSVTLVNGSSAAAGQIAVHFENIGGENFTVLDGQSATGDHFQIDIKGQHTLTGTDFTT
jgi:Ca2+-binding RTX toxin-like protein